MMSIADQRINDFITVCLIRRSLMRMNMLVCHQRCDFNKMRLARSTAICSMWRHAVCTTRPIFDSYWSTYGRIDHNHL